MRTRFTKTEKAAFTPGADVEVRNGRFWYPAIVTGTVEATPYGTFQVMCRVTGTVGRQGTVRTGDVWTGTPTNVRVPTSE
jgi:hypothetical protein